MYDRWWPGGQNGNPGLKHQTQKSGGGHGTVTAAATTATTTATATAAASARVAAAVEPAPSRVAAAVEPAPSRVCVLSDAQFSFGLPLAERLFVDVEGGSDKHCGTE